MFQSSRAQSSARNARLMRAGRRCTTFQSSRAQSSARNPPASGTNARNKSFNPRALNRARATFWRPKLARLENVSILARSIERAQPEGGRFLLSDLYVSILARSIERAQPGRRRPSRTVLPVSILARSIERAQPEIQAIEEVTPCFNPRALNRARATARSSIKSVMTLVSILARSIERAQQPGLIIGWRTDWSFNPRALNRARATTAGR